MVARLARNALRSPGKIDPDTVKSDLSPLPAPINNAIYKIMDKERSSRIFSKLPFGLTIIVLARKPLQ